MIAIDDQAFIGQAAIAISQGVGDGGSGAVWLVWLVWC